MDTMRERFATVTTELLDQDPRTALVLADIGAGGFAEAGKRHPDRVINVGIREQLLIGVTGGLALAGMRPIAHTFASFLIERPFEQVKLDLGHQGAGAVLVSALGSYDWPAGAGPTCPRATSRCSTPCPAGRCTCPATPTRRRRCCGTRWPTATARSTSGSRSTATPRPNRSSQDGF